MAGESKTINLNDKSGVYHYHEQPGNRDFQRDGRWDVTEESGKRNSVDYWNDRADNLMDRPRRGGTHRLTDWDLAESIRRSKNNRGEFEGLWLRGGTKPENVPTYNDLVREQMWRKSIREANGDKDKIAAINNDYVRREWDEYNQEKKARLEKENSSYTDWLRKVYGSEEDPIQNWRPAPVQVAKPIQPSVQPVAQDNTRVQASSVKKKLSIFDIARGDD